MMPKSKAISAEKTSLHPRNKHRFSYNFPELIKSCPELAPFVFTNQYKTDTIDFGNPEAVMKLNYALLKLHYGITYWDIPKNFLCPAIPGRADYIHYLADLLRTTISSKKDKMILDVGIGANTVYPLIGHKEYNWNFVGTDINPIALKTAQEIISNNDLNEVIACRLQPNPKNIFLGIIQPNEYYDATLCNPPFHSSALEATSGTQRKLKNLQGKKVKDTVLNFGGQNAELWYDGGEIGFINQMIEQSVLFQKQCFWFTTLVSKKTNLPLIYKALKKIKAVDIKTIEMAQGQKISRIIAWTFLSTEEQLSWKK
ncbi:23S rRNA (adenine(1618)-N(6))-methyltransferase RlmF [Flavobacterium sp. '19STA2R22 D10 B1']|uniref:23S rRNA (adenine(1618)-N(6))-methyltransferase RlmF n=1 Tax=Flavobacterium aerium TaxID=3037261 RepID=UPI00278C5594|nr:23S rRNA (adenine(1618)-N(6))-methyltransferase RlmF [Flavobacterium sp. '19STA2R22 D10 B1']